MKKSILLVAVLMALVSLCLVFASCDSGSSDNVPVTCTVSFDAGEGTGKMEPVTVEKGASYQVPACAFTAPSGKEFKCWNDGTADINVGETIVVGSDITLTAQWQDEPGDGPTPVTVTGVTLDKIELQMTVGDADVKLTATVSPEGATDKTVSWSSDKPEFATVDTEGNVHAVAAGEAIITVTTRDGGKTATCTVTVVAALPEGALSGEFSVGANKKVYFAKGNLQYQASTETWKFADNQYDYIGDAAGNNTAAANRATQSDWIDLFGWGTTGYQDTRTSSTGNQTNYQPYSSSNEGGYGPDYDDTNKYGLSVDSKSDWGCIESLPGNSSTTKVWRTLSNDEWDYLLNTRSGNRFAKANVNGVKGLVIFPDGYDLPSDYTADGGTGMAKVNATGTFPNPLEFPTVQIPTETWATMEAAGCVFLPAAGSRSGISVNEVGSNGHYWSTGDDIMNDEPEEQACELYFSNMGVGKGFGYHYYGYSVRLVMAEN